MNRRNPLLLLLMVFYIFAPTIFSWVISPSGEWYRPFIIWIFVIVIAFIVQAREKNHDL